MNKDHPPKKTATDTNSDIGVSLASSPTVKDNVKVKKKVKANLIIDIGTQSVRVAAVSMTNEILEVVAHDIDLFKLDEARFEQDGEDIVSKCESAIASLLSSSYDFVQAGIAIQRSSVIAWHRITGQPMFPSINWQDTRTAELFEEYEPFGDVIQAISGLVLSPHYGATKIKWLNDRLPNSENYFVAPLVSFLLFRLLKGSPYLCDESNAARTQMYDIHSRCWSDEACSIFDLSHDTLPEVKPVLSRYGTLKQGAIPVLAVCGDQNSAFYSLREQALAEDLSSEDTIYVNIGTGAFILSEASVDKNDPALLTSLIYSDDETLQYVQEGTVNGAGTVLQNMCDQWCENTGKSEVEFYQQIDCWYREQKEQKEDIPIFINTVGGLGSPYWTTVIPSLWINIKESEEPEVALKASSFIESIAFLIAINVEAITSYRDHFKSVLCSGGCSKLSVLNQLIADLTGLTVFVANESESTLLGVAEILNPLDKKEKRHLKQFSPECDNALFTRFTMFRSFLESLIQASKEGC